MKQQTTLLVLAAGMGSRYGGLKQIDPLGPNGEIIIDYALHDACLAGFSKIVFVIKEELHDTFSKLVGDRWKDRVEVAYAFQSLDDLPAGIQSPPGRSKPWGTAQAVYAARHVLDGAFGVIGADDFFGRDTFVQLHDFLRTRATDKRWCMVAFSLGNTLSEHGTVSRGVCSSKNGLLQAVVERTAIEKGADGQAYFIEEGVRHALPSDTMVSMNVWGLHTDLMGDLEAAFAAFLRTRGHEEKSEYYLPTFVHDMIVGGKAEVSVLQTTGQWYGVTHARDKEQVCMQLSKLHEQGVYPPLR